MVRLGKMTKFAWHNANRKIGNRDIYDGARGKDVLCCRSKMTPYVGQIGHDWSQHDFVRIAIRYKRLNHQVNSEMGQRVGNGTNL